MNVCEILCGKWHPFEVFSLRLWLLPPGCLSFSLGVFEKPHSALVLSHCLCSVARFDVGQHPLGKARRTRDGSHLTPGLPLLTVGQGSWLRDRCVVRPGFMRIKERKLKATLENSLPSNLTGSGKCRRMNPVGCWH